MVNKRPIVVLDNYTTGYIHDVDVLHNISMSVPETSVTSIIGSNGAGKSTVLRGIFGYLPARTGSIIFKGEDVTGWRPQTAILNGLAYVAQGRCNFPNMNVIENLEVACFTRKDKNINMDIDEMMDRFPVLREKRRTLAGNLSGGQQQILEMAMGLMVHPTLLLIDEPTLGLSPKFFDDVFYHIQKIKSEGVSVLMVEQNAARALEISDYAFVMNLGKIWVEGTGQEILSNKKVREQYLGAKPEGDGNGKKEQNNITIV